MSFGDVGGEFDGVRFKIKDVVVEEWDLFRKHVARQIEQLKPQLKVQESNEVLELFLEKLEKLKDEFITTKAYLKQEDGEKFDDFLGRLERASKTFFNAYLIENSLDGRLNKKDVTITMVYDGMPVQRRIRYNDGVEDHLQIMYDHIIEKSRGNVTKGRYTYPSVFQAINYVRNSIGHNNRIKPKDHSTGIKSFGNIFTFSSLLILSFYGFIEVLNKWIEVLETNYYTVKK